MKTILFHPMPIASHNKMWYYREYLKFTEVTENPDIAMFWDYSGQPYYQRPELFDKLKCSIINGGCLDISKTMVNEVHKIAMGYGTEADGEWCIEKTEYNGMKQCRLVRSDDRRKGYFYQKLLSGFGMCDEYRIFYFDGYIPMIAVKRKRVTKKNICGVTKRIDWVNTYEVLDQNSYIKIREFCRLFPVDSCELDMLIYDGRMYIIDVNPTPGDAAFPRLKVDDREKAIRILATAFKDVFL